MQIVHPTVQKGSLEGYTLYFQGIGFKVPESVGTLHGKGKIVFILQNRPLNSQLNPLWSGLPGANALSRGYAQKLLPDHKIPGIRKAHFDDRKGHIVGWGNKDGPVIHPGIPRLSAKLRYFYHRGIVQKVVCHGIMKEFAARSDKTRGKKKEKPQTRIKTIQR
jgi:hypothetical protein